MVWIELTIHTTTAGADIVSEALMAEGATGTMVEDRADIPDPDKPNGYWEIIDPNLISSMPEDVLVHAWFTPDSSFADRMQALRSRCDELHHMDLGLDLGTLEISTLNVRDEDWAEVWKKFYKPFKAGRSLVVKPTWEHYDPQPGDRIIEIDPGMAFGSGTHETTSMCLELLEDVLRQLLLPHEGVARQQAYQEKRHGLQHQQDQKPLPQAFQNHPGQGAASFPCSLGAPRLMSSNKWLSSSRGCHPRTSGLFK